MKLLIGLVLLVAIAIGAYVYNPQIAGRATIGSPSATDTPGGSTGPLGLTSVNRSNRGLTKFPSDILSMTTIQSLDLSGNDISKQDLEVIRAKLPSSTEIIL